MNDGQHPYDPYAQDPYGQEPRIYGYDAYGRPVYQPQAGQQTYDPQPGYDPYGQAQSQGGRQGQGGYGYDPYAQAPQQTQHPQAQHPQAQHPQAQHPQTQHHPQVQPYDGYAGQGQQQYAYDDPQQQGYGYGYTPTVPPQRESNPYEELSPEALRESRPEPPAEPEPGREPGAAKAKKHDEDYRTEQFSFVEEEDQDTDDVIDWLKFAETRSERRDERKRKGRNRMVALIVVLVLVAAGGVGYLWAVGKLPGLSDGNADQTAGGPQQRDVIVVHLRETRGGRSSTALLVDNETTKKGTTVLLPNALSVSTEEGGSTTLGKSVTDEGSDSTRESLSSLLGSKIQGTWRLDTPYLENLVELVGGITVTTDATVPDRQKGAAPLVKKGQDQPLGGQAAVAYATYRAPGEPQTKQLARFGQVMHASLKKLSSDEKGATNTVESLAQIPDPSLSEQQLGASLARLAGQAKSGDYNTAMLPVQQDGTLSTRATDHVVKDILGGTVKNTGGDTPRVSVTNEGGTADAAGSARVTLVNGGFTVVSATEGKGTPQTASRVTYAEAAQAAQAKEVAKTLGLPSSAVRKGKGAANADITVVLGQDYTGKG